MIRALLAAGVAAAAAAQPLVGQTEPLIQLSDHSAHTYDVSEGYPQGLGPYTHYPTLGDQEIAIELRYNVAVQVRLIGASADDVLTLRQANGAVTTVRVLCSWADLDGAVNPRTYQPFPCYASGSAGPPAPAAVGTTRRVILRVFAIPITEPRGAPAAGFFSGSAYFRVDAL